MLTEEQISRLFVFCEKHLVRHYDVQVELVDHLANAIEDRMAADPKLSFDAALIAVHGDFGVLGFSQVVKTQANALSKKYRREEWKMFRSYFTWPKIALTALVLALFLLPLQIFPREDLEIDAILVILILCFYENYVFYTARRRIKKQTRSLLFTEIGPLNSYITFFLLGQYFFLDPTGMFNDKSAGFILAYYIVLAFLATIVFMSIRAYDVVARRTYVLAQEKYPEAFTIAG